MFYCKKKKTLDLDATVLIVHKTSRYEIFSVVFKKQTKNWIWGEMTPVAPFWNFLRHAKW